LDAPASSNSIRTFLAVEFTQHSGDVFY
jgi:hypothetical protein